jgi:hypothetical protein
MIQLGGAFSTKHMLTKEHSAPKKSLEDLLAYLPCATIVDTERAKLSISPDRPLSGLYLVIIMIAGE